MSASSTLLFLTASALLASHSTVTKGELERSCPCDDPAHCEPITTGPRKELLGFVTNKDNWKKYNWTHITTLAMFTNLTSDLLCYAHSKGVRVVLSGSYPISELSNVSRRRAWIADRLQQVSQAHADGFNLDIEEPTRQGTDDTRLLTEFVGEFYTAFKKANENYQVSYDVAWSPDCIDGRCYDARGLSKVTDFLVVMSYDERSQIRGPCVASANSGANTTASGLRSYLDLGIGESQLVLGLPWYGYDYPCQQLSQGGTCFIKPVPFRGAKCSDAAGSEIPYSTINEWLPRSPSGLQWDPKLLSPYFNLKIKGTDHQVWFDNPDSLSAKYILADSKELRGLAFWTFDSLDYTGISKIADSETAAMWQALEIFFA